MLTKTQFFALLNDKESRINSTAHIAVFEESNGNTSLIIRQHSAPNAFLSTHKTSTTTNAAFAKYTAWLKEWFMAQTAAAEVADAAPAEALATDVAYDAQIAFECKTRPFQQKMVEWAHTDALEEDRVRTIEADRAAGRPVDEEGNDTREWCGNDIEAAHAEALEIEARRRIAEFFGGMDYHARREAVEAAHAEAREMNRYVGNADLLPQSGFCQADRDYLLAVNVRLHPDLLAFDVSETHAEALAMNETFDEVANMKNLTMRELHKIVNSQFRPTEIRMAALREANKRTAATASRPTLRQKFCAVVFVAVGLVLAGHADAAEREHYICDGKAVTVAPDSITVDGWRYVEPVRLNVKDTSGAKIAAFADVDDRIALVVTAGGKTYLQTDPSSVSVCTK